MKLLAVFFTLVKDLFLLKQISCTKVNHFGGLTSVILFQILRTKVLGRGWQICAQGDTEKDNGSINFFIPGGESLRNVGDHWYDVVNVSWLLHLHSVL